MCQARAFAVVALLAVGPEMAAGDWVNLADQTSSRIVADPTLVVDDPDEKDYAWADVDLDGDIDLVIVRKQPFSSTGRRANVLLMNEDGILVDRTAAYASASDVPDDQGFLTPTNDRDVAIADLNGDGYPEMVTATTMSDGQPKQIGHPRVYVNLGTVDGVWQGFRHEDRRIPQLFTDDKLAVNPRFNAVAIGDVTGDNAPDLFFGDSDLGGPPAENDLNDRLLVNDGNGFFSDQSTNLMTPEMLDSSLTTAVAIVDMNDDGWNDVVKSTGLSAPVGVVIIYNVEGIFVALEKVYSASPGHISVGDVNEDDRPDIVVTDDGVDRVLIHEGNDAEGLATFTTIVLADSSGFGGNSVIADLDRDSFSDVIITDIEIDIPGCSRLVNVYQNVGTILDPSFLLAPPAGFEVDDRSGTHDAAVFDINGDGWLDIVLGRCEGTRVWINDPPAALGFFFFAAPPQFLSTQFPTTFELLLQLHGEAIFEYGSGRVHFSVDGGPFEEGPLIEVMGLLLRGTLPAADCLSRVEFYVSAETVDGGVFTDPPSAPAETFLAYAVDGVVLDVEDDLEGDTSGWTVVSEDLVSGAWEVAAPNGTLDGGEFAAPPEDATPDGELAFVTENGVVGGAAGVNDVDGGPTHLVTPVIALDGGDGVVTYARWFFCNDAGAAGEDELRVGVSNDDGATWVAVPAHTTTGTVGVWETVSFVVGDYVMPTETIRVRFTTSDLPNDSITEAGIDDLRVERIVCAPACLADLDGDGLVAFDDLLTLLSVWGACPACPEDLDGNGVVAFGDLLMLLSAWGPCP